MDVAAPHAGFVAAAYALSFGFICGLTIHVILRDRWLRAEAERLDARRRKDGT